MHVWVILGVKQRSWLSPRPKLKIQSSVWRHWSSNVLKSPYWQTGLNLSFCCLCGVFAKSHQGEKAGLPWREGWEVVWLWGWRGPRCCLCRKEFVSPGAGCRDPMVRETRTPECSRRWWLLRLGWLHGSLGSGAKAPVWAVASGRERTSTQCGRHNRGDDSDWHRLETRPLSIFWARSWGSVRYKGLRRSRKVSAVGCSWES